MFVRRMRRAGACGAGMAMLVGALVGVSPAVSAGSAVDPNQTVSSDGSTPETVNSGARGSAPFQGRAPQPESVIGADGRARVNNTRTFPFRATGHITFQQGPGSGQFICTGWLINRNTVATAGHCVHQGGGGVFSRNVRFFPGRNGASQPYGSCAARRLSTVAGWATNGNPQYDYGTIKLNCNIGNTVGWFGFWWQASSLNNLAETVSGYPGDKAFGTQWRHADRVRVTQARRVFYANDTFGGQSGAPVWQNRPAGAQFCSGGPCSLAIHAYGVGGGSFPGNTYNSGTRINQAVFNNLVTWANAA